METRNVTFINPVKAVILVVTLVGVFALMLTHTVAGDNPLAWGMIGTIVGVCVGNGMNVVRNQEQTPVLGVRQVTMRPPTQVSLASALVAKWMAGQELDDEERAALVSYFNQPAAGVAWPPPPPAA